jgi:hypothetical protein
MGLKRAVAVIAAADSADQVKEFLLSTQAESSAVLRRLLRPIFIGIGLSLLMGGASLLFVERVSLRDTAQMAEARMPSVFVRIAPTVKYELTPPAWIPLTMLASGGLTVLYSIALPKNPHAG